MGWCISSEEAVIDPAPEEKGNESDDGVKTGSLKFKGPVKIRTCTDAQYLVLFIAFLILWIVLVAYCIYYGNIFRLLHGYDDCGNICGHITKQAPPLCTGANMTDKPYLQILPKEEWSTAKKKCISSCNDPNYKRYWNRCVPKGEESFKYFLLSKSNLQTFFQEAAEDIHNTYWQIIYLCLLALVLSVILVFLFRYFAGFLVWFVIIGVLVFSVCISTYLWIVWVNKRRNGNSDATEFDERNTTTHMVYAIIASVVTLVIALLIFAMRKSVTLVSQLFKEAGKAVQSMPCLLTLPFVTFCSIALLLVMWINFYLWIESAGYPALKAGTTNRVTYVKNDIIKFTRWYNLVALFWIVQFLISCQHMVIAGAVATWFFTRKKEELESPICKSYVNLVRYHLGTVALGSFILAAVAFIRLLFKLMESAVKDGRNQLVQWLHKACSCCLYCLDKILVYLTRNAYIETAIYGDSLWNAGKRAFSILVSNSMKVIAINSVGDFVLFLGEAIVVKTTVFVGFKLLQDKEGINHLAVPLVIVGVFAFVVVHSFISAFEMIIDTIFICFCEDCELNDGVSRPYFMNKGLMEFVERSQKVLKVGDSASVQ